MKIVFVVDSTKDHHTLPLVAIYHKLKRKGTILGYGQLNFFIEAGKRKALEEAADKAMEDKEDNIEIGVDDETRVSPQKKEKKNHSENIRSDFRFSASQQKRIQVKLSQERSICNRSRYITVNSSLVGMKLAIKKKLTL